MDYLARTTAPFGDDLWEQIDSTVIDTAKKTMVARRFLPLYGPLGAGAQGVNIDLQSKEEAFEDGFVRTQGRKYVELPQIFEDFWVLWRDLEANQKMNTPIDLSVAARAAQALAHAEDKLVFFGNEALGHEGLLNAQGINKMKREDWGTGENAFSDIAAAAALLDEKGVIGRYTLVLGPDLFYKLQRIQPGTGMMEIERIRDLLNGRVHKSNSIAGKAALVCAESQFMDLAIGQDMASAYLELVDLNHHFRILETLALRIKNPEAIVVFE